MFMRVSFSFSFLFFSTMDLVMISMFFFMYCVCPFLVAHLRHMFSVRLIDILIGVIFCFIDIWLVDDFSIFGCILWNFGIMLIGRLLQHQFGVH